MDGDTRLRHPRNARQRMVIDPHTRIERHPRADMLAEIQIARHLVYGLVNQRIRLPLTLALDIDVSRPPAESEVVHPKGQTVATEHLHALVRRHARHIVVGIETVGTGTRPRGIAVVDIMMSEIVEAAHRTRGALVAVADRERSHAARDRLVGVLERLCDRARLRGIEMRHIDIGGDIPLRREIVAQLGIAAVLLERHVRAVAVGAVVRSTDHGGNATLVYSVGRLGLDRVVRPVACVKGRMDALLGLARNDIDHTAHGIRAVQHRGGTTQDLHPLRHESLVGVGDRVPHQPHILRVAVDKHHQLPRAAAQTAQGDSTRPAARHAVTHHTTGGSEKTRDLLRKQRKQRGLVALLDSRTGDNTHSFREMTDVRTAACARNDHLGNGVRIGGLLGGEGGGCGCGGGGWVMGGCRCCAACQ